METIDQTPEERRRRLKREANARWRAAHPERVRKANREANARWYAGNLDRAREANREASARWYAANQEKAREANREANARWYATPEGRKYVTRRLADDPEYRLAMYTRNRVRAALRAALAGKSDRSLNLLGCTAKEYRVYLEGLFRPGMTGENWSPEGWHIDHKRPLASFDLSDPAQQREAFHFTNTAPTWSQENLSKGSLHGGVRHRRRST